MPTGVLIIEDEFRLARNIQLYLERSGFVVRNSANGLDGLEEFRRFAPEIVLLDLGFRGRPPARWLPLTSGRTCSVTTRRRAVPDPGAYCQSPTASRTKVESISDLNTSEFPPSTHYRRREDVEDVSSDSALTRQ